MPLTETNAPYNALRLAGSYAELIEGAKRSTLTQLAS